MQQKTFTIFILVVLGIGGVFVWYVWPTGDTVTPTTTTTQPPFGNTTSVTTYVPPGTATTQEPADAYQELLTSLFATPLKFQTVSSAEDPTFGEIYELYAEDIAESNLSYPEQSDSSIEAALADLDEDGTEEAVVYESLPWSCGSAGCSVEVWQKADGVWTVLLSTLAYDSVAVMQSATNGRHNLLLSIHGNVGYMTNIVQFVWNGTRYQPGTTVATWDGNTFQIAQ